MLSLPLYLPSPIPIELQSRIERNRIARAEILKFPHAVNTCARLLFAA